MWVDDVPSLTRELAGELFVLGPVVGIGMSGTAAAVEIVCDEQLMQQVRRRIGAGFKDHDFEVVIGTDLVNGLANSPNILAVAVR